MKRLLRRIRALFRGESLDRELSDEIRQHLELETEDLVRTKGLTPEEARRQALVAFGGVERYREAQHDARGVRWIEESLADLRYASRVLLRSPGYTIPAILVLGLGIGATTAVFSVVATAFGRLPYPNDEQLVRIYEQNSPTNRWTNSVADFQAIEGQAHTLSAVGALSFRSVPVAAGGDPQTLTVTPVTSGFMRALEVRPIIGRPIQPADDPVGAPPVVVVSDAFARRTLGGAAVVGKSMMIDGRAHTVIGILPPGVRRLAGIRSDLWPVLQLGTPTRRGPFGLLVIGRLKSGVTLEACRKDLADVSHRLQGVWSDFSDAEARLTPYSLRRMILGDGAGTIGVFAAAVLLVLLIAVANVASLTLVRTTGRWHELALRAALGASRTRLVRLVTIECVALASAGAVLGVALGAAGLRLLLAIGPFIPRLDEARLDTRAVAFAVALAVLAGIVVAAYPLVSLLRRDPSGALAGGERTVGGGQHAQTVRGAFVVGEFALALPLLAVAGLLLNSFLRLQRVDPGFAPEPVATARVSLPVARYGNDTVLAEFWRRMLPTLGTLGGGVTLVSLGDALPPDANQNFNQNNFDLIDHPVGEGRPQPTASWITVTRDYFGTLDVPLLEGRLFTPADTGSSPPVVVVSRAWAHHYFPGENAVGRQMIEGGCIACPRTTIVGVVGDVRYDGLTLPGEAIYGPMEQGPWRRTVHLFVRTRAGGTDALPAIRAALLAFDPGVSIDQPQAMREVFAGSIEEPRHLTTLLSGFALAALALAAVGIFGLLSYVVAARRREIGVRMALGADRRAVVAMIVSRGLWLAGVGALIGLVIAVVGTRWLAASLFQVSPTDPVTLGLVTLALLAVALVACWVPAHRAAATDPVQALRAEA
ncbi:MAG TPA: ADOP family duplicated permease [Gemmatimonadales bacterium]|nr:ADOP family duplicated permease [Gemmatimonadales bacterium]